MKISIFGTGYVGLVTGACLSELGHDVLCVDIDKIKIEKLKNGIIPIFEPGLEEVVKKNYENQRLNFTTDMQEAIEFGKVIFSAVGTPPDTKNHNKADLKYVYEVAKSFGKYVTEYKVFVNKSTVPVGTGLECIDIIKHEIYQRNLDIDFDVVSNPEFLREGNAVKDFLLPDRVVIGSQREKAKNIMEDIYKALKKNSTELGFTQIIHTDINSAEVIKYASNAFLAVKISFINEIANFCEHVGANIENVALGVGTDRRIGKTFLNAGIGYGGSCFPKDLQALIETGKDFGQDFEIISAAHNVNEKQKNIFLKKLTKHLGDVKGKKIGIWGLAFKPNTDDIRFAPSISTIEALIKKEVKEIRIYDPVALAHIEGTYKNVVLAKNAYNALEDVDALLLITEWDEFKTPNVKMMKKTMRGNLILDGRNIWEKQDFTEYEMVYEGIGKI